jgi:hypothetical protein
VKLKASHERHFSLAELCFPIVIVTLNQMSCGAFLQRYPLTLETGTLGFIWHPTGNDSPFPHMHHGLTVRIDCESGSLRASICSRKILGTIL